MWKISQIPSNLSSEMYSDPYHTCKWEIFTKIVHGFHPLTIFAKSSLLDVWWKCEYASDADSWKFK